MTGINLEEFFDTKSLDKLAGLATVLSEDRLSARDTGIPYRTLNHWDEMKIIRFTRTSDIGNRRFNFIDFVWIKVVNELRSLGLNLKMIQQMAKDVYEPMPTEMLFEAMEKSLDKIKQLEGEDKEGYIQFIKSGEYKTEEFKDYMKQFNLLYMLIAESIETRQSVAVIVFNDGEWIPFMKDKEHLYPKELLYKIEFHSQIRVNITDLIFKFIVQDSLSDYANGMSIFNPQEEELLKYVLQGDYKKVMVIFKSKKNEPIEISKNKIAVQQIVNIIRQQEYREFILTDKKGKEFRIRTKANELLNEKN